MVIFLIAFIALWAFERNRNQRLRHENNQLIQRVSQLEGVVYPSGAKSEEQDEIDSKELQELRERVQVLERIATDDNSLEARKAQKIAREIESLRGDIARRSATRLEASEQVEDLSE